MHDPKPNRINPPENEIRLIVVGATEFAKSTTGSIMRQNRMSSWCYPEKTKMKTLFQTIGSKDYKIDVIDTPPNGNYSKLPKNIKHCEIEKAIALSAPGPHAFLLCIPATKLQSDLIDAIKPYEGYFNNDCKDFVIVVFTHYNDYNKFNTQEASINEDVKLERFKEDLRSACEQKTILKRITKNYIVLNTYITTDEKVNTMKQVIELIRERENKGEDFVTGHLSEEAETVLQNKINDFQEKENTNRKIVSSESVQITLRDKVKMGDEYLSYFQNKCLKKN